MIRPLGGGNLDIILELYNSSQTLIASSNPAATVNASISQSVAAGDYYLVLKPSGAATPQVVSPSGYTVYGSLGQYTLTGNFIPTTSIALTAPNGGESWVRGSTQSITWASGMGGNVKIELFKNGVLNTTITASTPNDGSHSWPIPVGQTLGPNYRMRITSVETPAKFDESVSDFTIDPGPIYYASMDTNPGWTLQGAWAWGIPTASGGDPASGYNGVNVIGYNLSGQYTNNMVETFATTPVINCSNRSNVQLSFYRWLGIEAGNYDRAYIRVSNNGSTWTNVYAHNTSGNGTFDETSWSLQTYDISSIADNQSTVYVRWVMGTTDNSVTYSGWNIDEVLVNGDLTGGGYAVVITPSGGATNVTEGGASDTYTVHLAEQPAANVTVNITPNSQVTVSSSSLTFTSVNWATPQTVTVSAFNDSANEFAHTGTINHSATSADANYNAIGVDGIVVNITDNDNIAPAVNAGTDQSVTLTGVSWTPADVGPLAWYDATDTATITQVAGAVSQWADKVGTSHMIQATGANQPLSGTTTINGLNSISFDGTNDALKTASNPFGASINDAMMMGVFNIGTITNSTLFSLSGSSANRWQSHAPWSDSSLYFDCGGSGGVNRISGATGWAASQNKLLGFYCSTTDNAQQVWVDGTSLLSDATGHTVPTAGGLSLGYDGGGSWDNCRMGEVVVISGAVSATNRQKLEGFLAHKWGLAGSLPVAHPYKTQPPTNGAAIANLNGTVSDANGDSFTTAWTVVSGPASVSFGNVNAVDTTASFSVAGIYTLRLTASDPGASTFDDVVITVNPSADFAVTYAGNTQSGGTPPATQFKSPSVNLTLATNSGGLVKTGHSFAGWNSAANGGGTDYATGSTYSTDANLALYAKWIPDTYLVTYNANGATSGTAPSDQTKTYGANLTLATNSGTLARTGYTFAGWNTAADGTGTSYAVSAAYAINAPLTLYAKWTITTYAVTYNINSATSGTAPASQTKTYGIDLTLQTNSGTLARTGYTFAGWNTLANGAGTSYAEGAVYTANAALPLFAKWTPDTYPVTYNANGATSGTAPADQTKTYAVNLTLANNTGTLAKTGYTFAGWNTAADGTGTSYAVAAAYATNAPLTLYAKWTIITYAVTYNINSATSGTAPASQTKTYGIDLTLQTNSGTLARTGYTFAGWNTLANGTGTSYAEGAVYTANAALPLFAKWTLDTYPVTYNANSATSGTIPSAQTKTYAVNLTLQNNTGTLARTGYSFVGWNTQADGLGTSYAVASAYTANAAVTLFATWTANSYAVTYNANSATSGTIPSAQTKTHDVSLTLQNNTGTLARTGYTFAGWNTLANGLGTDYAVASAYTANTAVTLFAKWTTGNTFASWILGFSGLNGLTSFNNDADGDGIANGVEAFFGTAPNAQSSGLSAVTFAGSALTLTHPEAASQLSNVTGSYEWSLNLSAWNASGVPISGTTVTIVAVKNTPAPGTTTVTATVTGTQPGRIFVRAVATQN